MSRSPLVIGKADHAFARTQLMQDTTIGWRFVNPAMDRLYGTASMPQTAENVASRYGITREAQDAYALQSQQRAAAAQARGFFATEITAVTVGRRGGEVIIAADEHLRPGTTIEALAALHPVVHAGGSVTAGNASGVNDGSAALIIASEAAAMRHGLKPQARLLGMASAGVEPDLMGIGPVPASRRLMGRLGMTLPDFDIVEINEAFASQVIASLCELGGDPTSPQINPNGGAIALGHPLGMSGARLVMTAAHSLSEVGGRRALITMCVGVGQGLAIAIERC